MNNMYPRISRKCLRCGTQLKLSVGEMLFADKLKGRSFIRCSRCNVKLTTRLVPHIVYGILGTIGYIPALLVARHFGDIASICAVVVYGFGFVVIAATCLPLQVIDETPVTPLPLRTTDDQ